MRVKKIVPVGWPCTLLECPPGFFIIPSYPEMLCFKSEYGQHSDDMQVYNCAGEYSNTQSGESVQPVEMIVEEEEV